MESNTSASQTTQIETANTDATANLAEPTKQPRLPKKVVKMINRSYQDICSRVNPILSGREITSVQFIKAFRANFTITVPDLTLKQAVHNQAAQIYLQKVLIPLGLKLGYLVEKKEEAVEGAIVQGQSVGEDNVPVLIPDEVAATSQYEEEPLKSIVTSIENIK